MDNSGEERSSGRRRRRRRRNAPASPVPEEEGTSDDERDADAGSEDSSSSAESMDAVPTPKTVTSTSTARGFSFGGRSGTSLLNEDGAGDVDESSDGESDSGSSGGLFGGGGAGDGGSASPRARSGTDKTHKKKKKKRRKTRDNMASRKLLKFRGCGHFRQRIVLATLSGKSVVIDEIRVDSEEPGVTDAEVSFLKLIAELTNGSAIRINETGTKVTFRPGTIVGGKVTFDCGTVRGIGYFLEGAVCLAPFGKKATTLTLTGLTNESVDVSVDIFRTVVLPFLTKHFGVEDAGLAIKKRGAPPDGGGSVLFTCIPVRKLNPILVVEQEQVRRIRGIAYSTRVSPQMSNRMVDAAKGVLTDFTADCFIKTDHYRGRESGRSPGYGLMLVAETVNGGLYSADGAADGPTLPEDIAEDVSAALLDEVNKGGCCDTVTQPFALTFMALSPEDVSKIRIGQLSQYSIQQLRAIRDFFGVVFRIKRDPETRTLVLTCVGAGYQNFFKRVT